MNALLILILFAAASWFFGLPYYYAYQRRQKLMEDGQKSDARKEGFHFMLGTQPDTRADFQPPGANDNEIQAEK